MNLTAMAQRSLSVSPKAKDYKELYEETKRNTATFIKLVEEELNKILNQHKKEKAWMEKEIYLLREELKQKKYQEESKCETYRKDEPSNLSVGKFDLEENTKNFLNCGISEISMNQSKSYLTDRKKHSIFNFPLHDKQKNTVNQREKSLKEKVGKDKLTISDKSTLNVTATLKTLNESKQNYTSSMLLPESIELSGIRERLCKQRGGKKNVCHLKDKQSLTQVLKNIRYKSVTPKVQNYNRQNPQYLETNIIVPGMFDIPKKR